MVQAIVALGGERDMAQYWVVTSKSADASFHEALDDNEEWFGPLDDYDSARREWAKRVATKSADSETQHRIERIDADVPPACTD